MQRDGRRRDRHHPSANGEDAVHLANALLEVAALEVRQRGDQEIADGVTAELTRRGVHRIARGRFLGLPRKAVLEQAGHHRLRVGQGGDAVADIAHGWDAQLLPERARRPAVIGHRDHGRQVARVLLEAAEERGHAGPATDRDDARAACALAALVDQLDQRLTAVLASKRLRDRPKHPICPEANEDGPGQPDDQSTQGVGQGLQGDQVDEALRPAPRLRIATDLANHVCRPKGEQEEPAEHDEQPALDPDAREQPAPEVHRRSSSRWKTATGPNARSRTQPARLSTMTIDRW